MSDLRQCWQCSVCKSLRIYGSFCQPEIRSALIDCGTCGRPTRHLYSHQTFEEYGVPARYAILALRVLPAGGRPN